MRMQVYLLMVPVAVAVSHLISSANGERGTFSLLAIRALRHAGHVKRQQTFGTCTYFQAMVFVYDYPSNCTSMLRDIDLTALEKGDRDELERVDNFLCETCCGQPMVNLLCGCGFESEAEVIVQGCGLNAQGQRCTLREVIEPMVDALTVAERECLPYNSTGYNCSLACKTALETARDLAGCCVNIYNITRTDHFEFDNYALWASCDVETLGFCGGSSLSTSGNCNELPSPITPTTDSTPDVTSPPVTDSVTEVTPSPVTDPTTDATPTSVGTDSAPNSTPTTVATDLTSPPVTYSVPDATPSPDVDTDTNATPSLATAFATSTLVAVLVTLAVAMTA